ncbi:hypothetical protein RCH16_003028 [Cryobacterium sp. MP_M5]|uniref:hypothetical protein n=1 Tax=unclassified Cryobacterium TaxID=2649013 RepID=UPI001A232FB4|nr:MULTISPECIES: hypothetical protein [unclassified Cryobacterium]MBG6059594.1 hypothetical protein [Cryobacterium sp. MP_M3]MEC5178001.1 hypothetical protein [Cryobacterium sp. MP_M5]
MRAVAKIETTNPRTTKLGMAFAGLVVSVVSVVGISAPAYAVTKVSQASAESQFRAAGVTWSSSGNCSTRSNSTCTSFDQVNQSSVSGIVTLRNASGCAINITGGTEVGHASGTYSHYNGYKIDISHNNCNNAYITGSFTRIADRGDGAPQYQAASGNIYADEGSHWDITYFG